MTFGQQTVHDILHQRDRVSNGASRSATYHREAFLEFDLRRDELLMEARHVDGISDALAEPEIVDGDLGDGGDDATSARATGGEDDTASGVGDQDGTHRRHRAFD